MEKRYTAAMAATLAALLYAAPAGAQGPNNPLPRHAREAAVASESLIQRSEIWGDWNGAEPSTPLPTGVFYYFYDNDNRLVAKMKAQNFAYDDDTTDEVEKEGDQKPAEFTRYIYDEAGNMVRAELSKFGVYDWSMRTWTEPVADEVNTYDAAGHLLHTTGSAGTASRYTWDGDNMVEQSDTARDGSWSKTTVFADFVAGKKNLPQSDYSISKWKQMFAGTYTYDEAGKPLTYTQTQIKKATADPDTHHLSDITLADVPYSKKEYTYDDAGNLIATTDYYWNNSKAAFVENTKETRELQEDGSWKVCQLSYNSGTDKWTSLASYSKEYNAAYTKGSAPAATAVSTTADGTGVTVSCDTDGADGGQWKVYRNGEYLADAAVADGTASYTDTGLHNCAYTYFMEHVTDAAAHANVSVPAKAEVSYSYPAPQHVRITSQTLSGIASRKTWKVSVSWEAPESVDGLDLVSYNVLCDVSDTNPYPTPANDKVQSSGIVIANPLSPETTSYTVSWDADDDPLHTIYVEAVYGLGRVKSIPVTVNLGGTGTRAMESRSQMGDALGETADNTASKVTHYYYDDNQRLVREITSHRLTGDDEGTPDVVEKDGDYQPDALKSYVYDKAGNLTEVTQTKYGLYQGYQLAWGEAETVSTYKYDAQNHCTEWEDGSKRYVNTWDGDNLVKQQQYIASTGSLSCTLTFSDFVAGKTNLPQLTIKDGTYTSNQRVIETAYDADGNKLTEKTYKYGEATRDADGNVTSVTKGTPEYSEAWTYADGILTLYTKQKWNATAAAFADYSKTEYVQGYEQETETTYTYSDGSWKSGRPYVNTYKTVYSGTAATKFAAAKDDSQLNTVKLTATANTDLWGSPSYLVFRNGVCLGKATVNSTGRQLTYVDKAVPNGTWDYFIQADNATANVAPAVTTPASVTLDTELPAVTKITEETKTKDSEYFHLHLAWEAPETDIPVVGYNVYSDIPSYTKNAAPDNDKVYLTEPTYDWAWIVGGDTEKDVYIEVVYNIGRKRSEAFHYVLDDSFSGISSATADKAAHSLTKHGATILGGEGCRSIELYSADGTRRARGGDSLSLSALPKGVYVARATMADGTTATLKVVND